MNAIPFLSVCSGIEAASVALEPLGFRPVGFAEIDRAASCVLAHHYGSNLPGDALSHNGVPNHGDFTAIDVEALPTVAWLIGGTPCQAFSAAGKRLSLADARGNLSLAYAVLAHELVRSRGLEGALWENVPGVLSTSDNAFGCLLGALVGADDPLLPAERPARGRSNAFWKWRDAGRWPVLDDDGNETGEFVERPEGWQCRWPDVGMVAGGGVRAAWRVLDAQYFGLAQRRRRVFLVVGFGDGVDPAAILFEPASMSRNHPPRREAGQRPSGTLSARTQGGGGLGTDFDLDGGLVAFGEGNRSGPVAQAATLTAKGQRCDFEVETFIAHSLRAEGFDASEDGTGRGTPLVPVPLAFSCKDYGADATPDLTLTLRAMGHDASHANAGRQMAVAFDLRGRDGGAQFEGPHDTANIRAASGGSSRSYVAFAQNSRSEVRLIGGDGDVVGAVAADVGAQQQSYVADVRMDGRDKPGHDGEQWAVRRLTPREAERLQGFPDDWTLVPGRDGKLQADGPRYKQLGNPMAVPCIAWIGRRIIEASKR